MPAPYPMLRLGSFGDAVTLLQRALNLAPTIQPRLAEDGQFGPKTHGRVREFQGQKNVAQDGVVGPVTWAQLEPFVKALTTMLDQASLPPQQEAALRQRIADIARSSFDVWGWGEKGTPKPDGSTGRIAAAFGYGPYVGDMRARQGGPALALIYSMASTGGANCLAIRRTTEEAYRLPLDDPRRTPAINQDIGSWCGIFATYCLRAAGLTQATWDRLGGQVAPYFTKLGYNEPVLPGDVGVYLYDKRGNKVNHHFMIVEPADRNETIHSVDGNLSGPDENVTAVTIYSVLSKRKYFRNTLKASQCTILRPNFAALK